MSGIVAALAMRMMTRKQFLKDALGASAAVLGLAVLHACGSSGSSGTSGNAGNCLQNGTEAMIATNHGHVLVVSKQDVMEAAEKAYDIQGSADHPHTVTISEDMFATLAGDHAVMTQSSLNNSAAFGTHSHSIMVACA